VGTGGNGGGGPDPCEPIPGASFTSLPTIGAPTVSPPAAQHPDINLKIRGWEPTGGSLGLVDYNGPTDPNAPRLNTLYQDGHIPTFLQNYRVNDWDWSTNSVGGPITSSPVTLVDFPTSQGMVLQVPMDGYDIGNGMQARILFADADSVTLKYTGEDNVIYGYTIHMVGICLDPALSALYHSDDAAGRKSLPALAGKQPFARARGGAVSIAIRDTGTFMDPRSHKDWWP
jgi:hypothetical protein